MSSYIRELSLSSRIDNIEVIYLSGKSGETEDISTNDWDFIIIFFLDFFNVISLLWKRNEIHFCCLTFETRYLPELIKPSRY